jgi:hypothetical protein
MDRVFIIDRLEGIRRGQDIDFVERLRAVQAFPMMDGPVFEIKLKAVVVFLKEIRTPAKGTHDRVHHLSSDFRPSASGRERENHFSCARVPRAEFAPGPDRKKGLPLTSIEIKYTVIS